MIRKPKAAKSQSKASGRQELKAAKTQPESNGLHELKSSKTQPNADGLADRKPLSGRSRKATSPQHERTLEKFRGMLQDFNFNPKGGVEGFLLHSEGQTVQVNVSVDVGFAVVRGIGQQVEATVEPDATASKHHRGDHPVYRLVTLTGTDGKALIHSGDGDGKEVTVQGVVRRINYARDGAANGVVLDSGAFVYLKPEAMKRAALKVGDHVTAQGKSALMPLGQQVIEAKTVNEVAVTSKKSTH